jgi:hypothetical protein
MRKTIAIVAMSFSLAACVGGNDGLTEASYTKVTSALNPPAGQTRQDMSETLNAAERRVFACLSNRKSEKCSVLAKDEKTLAWKIMSQAKPSIMLEYGKGT